MAKDDWLRIRVETSYKENIRNNLGKCRDVTDFVLTAIDEKLERDKKHFAVDFEEFLKRLERVEKKLDKNMDKLEKEGK